MTSSISCLYFGANILNPYPSICLIVASVCLVGTTSLSPSRHLQDNGDAEATSTLADESSSSSVEEDTQQTLTAQGISLDCFTKTTGFAGDRLGTEFSDQSLHEEKLRGDMRVWGFNICRHSNGVVSGFGLVVAPNFGFGEVVDTEGDQVVGELSTAVDSDTLRLTVGG